MDNSNHHKNIISLKSDGFSLLGRCVNDSEWYEFDAVVSGKEFKSIGGEDRTIILGKLHEIISKNEGLPINKIENSAYKYIIGDSDAEYVGYLVFSGYHTFYFFRAGGYLKHIILANRDGHFMAHGKLTEEVASLWLNTISLLREN